MQKNKRVRSVKINSAKVFITVIVSVPQINSVSKGQVYQTARQGKCSQIQK